MKTLTKRLLLVVLFALFTVSVIGITTFRVNAEGVVIGTQTEVDGLVELPSFKILNSASVRISEPYGIRFESEISVEDLNKLPVNATFGTLILPSSILGENELTVSTEKAVNVKATVFGENSTEQTKVFTGVLVGSENSNFASEFAGVDLSARSYVTYSDKSGTEHTVYGAVKGNETATSVSRSMAYVASSAIASGEELDGDSLTFINNMIDGAIGEKEISFTTGKIIVYANEKADIPGIANAEGLNLVYSCDSEDLIIEDGKVSSVKAGSYTLTATLGSKSAQLQVKVIDISQATCVSVTDESGYGENAGSHAVLDFGSANANKKVDFTMKVLGSELTTVGFGEGSVGLIYVNPTTGGYSWLPDITSAVKAGTWTEVSFTGIKLDANGKLTVAAERNSDTVKKFLIAMKDVQASLFYDVVSTESGWGDYPIAYEINVGEDYANKTIAVGLNICGTYNAGQDAWILTGCSTTDDGTWGYRTDITALMDGKDHEVNVSNVKVNASGKFYIVPGKTAGPVGVIKLGIKNVTPYLGAVSSDASGWASYTNSFCFDAGSENANKSLILSLTFSGSKGEGQEAFVMTGLSTGDVGWGYRDEITTLLDGDVHTATVNGVTANSEGKVYIAIGKKTGATGTLSMRISNVTVLKSVDYIYTCAERYEGKDVYLKTNATAGSSVTVSFKATVTTADGGNISGDGSWGRRMRLGDGGDVLWFTESGVNDTTPYLPKTTDEISVTFSTMLDGEGRIKLTFYDFGVGEIFTIFNLTVE